MLGVPQRTARHPEPEWLDMRPLRARASQLLAPDNPYRILLEKQPDWLPRDQGMDVIRVCLAHFAVDKKVA